MKIFSLIFAVFAGVALAAAEPAAVQTAPAKTQPAAVQTAPAKTQPAAVQTAPAKTQPAAVQKAEEPGIAFCLARGLCNMATGWLELPRCMIYDNGFIPVFGLFVGIPEGAGFTVVRTLSGVYDFISFGTSGKSCHGKIFPDTVFQSKWKCRQ